MKTRTNKGRSAASEAGGKSPLHAVTGGAKPPSSNHVEVLHRMLVVRKEFWSQPKALEKFDQIVNDLRARIQNRTKMQAFSEIVYQWCVINGQQYWCACVTEIVGGVPQTTCYPV